MREEHIIEVLERGPLAGLSESEQAAIRAHTSICDGCKRAYEAARIAALLLKERADSAIEPSPFFQTKVLAALRERQLEKESWSWRRLWKTTGALVSSMAVTVVALGALTLFGAESATTTGSPDVASISDPYSGEELILAQDELESTEMSYDQVLSTLYASESDNER